MSGLATSQTPRTLRNHLALVVVLGISLLVASYCYVLETHEEGFTPDQVTFTDIHGLPHFGSHRCHNHLFSSFHINLHRPHTQIILTAFFLFALYCNGLVWLWGHTCGRAVICERLLTFPEASSSDPKTPIYNGTDRERLNGVLEVCHEEGICHPEIAAFQRWLQTEEVRKDREEWATEASAKAQESIRIKSTEWRGLWWRQRENEVESLLGPNDERNYRTMASDV